MKKHFAKYLPKISIPKLLLVVVILFSSKPIFSLYDFNSGCVKAYNEIISLNFRAGKKLLDKEKEINPDNKIILFLENYIDFLTLSIGENKLDFEKLSPHRAERIEALQSIKSASPWHRHTQATIYLQWAFARVKFGEYFMAALDMNRAYRLLADNKKKNPEFVPDLLLDGVINVLIGSIPEKYKWTARLAGMEGNIETGRNKLYELIRIAERNHSWSHFRSEAFFYLSFIEINLHNDKNAVIALLKRIETSKDLAGGPLIYYVQANLNKHIKENDKVIEVIENCDFSSNSYPFYYLDFVLGCARLNRLDKNAARPLLDYVNRYGGSNYIKSAYQRLAWNSLINGDENAYHFYISQIPDHGQAFTDEDKQAQAEALSNELPNIRLLKARLLFDGGYFETALKTLQNGLTPFDLPSKKDSLEYIYRKARIFHEWEKITQAVSSYELVIDSGKDLPYFYAGNSALQLGLIYEVMKQPEKALHYYNMCLKLRFNDYQTSIHQKAKAGISRISGKK